MRGRKPKPTGKKEILGNPGKRPLPENEPVAEGAPVKPPGMRGAASKLWDEYLPRLPWLTAADSHTFANWCKLQAVFDKDPAHTTAAVISQIRGLAASLGMDPSSRTRLGGNGKKKPADPADEFFSGPELVPD